MGDYQQYLPSKQEPKSSQPNLDEKQRLDEKAYRGWEEAFREGPLQRLRYLDALLARTTDPDQISRIKSRSAELIREVGPVAVLSDPSLISMVRQLFGAAGYERLKDRAKTAQLQQPDVVANMASPVHQRGER
jgi:hypothetical protein